MVIARELNEIINNTKELSLNIQENGRFELLKNDLTETTEKAIFKAAKYIIKAMPIPDAAKDILTDITNSLKTKSISNVISTAVKSTIREGLELLGISKSNINSITNLTEIAKKGGLITALKNGVEIIANNYLKNNIVAKYVYTFFEKLGGYIQSKEFTNTINRFVNKLDSKKGEFIEKCEKWYKAYNNMDLNSMNNIAKELSENKYVISRYRDCSKENSIIQNMMEMVNNKKGILSKAQQELCEVL